MFCHSILITVFISSGFACVTQLAARQVGYHKWSHLRKVSVINVEIYAQIFIDVFVENQPVIINISRNDLVSFMFLLKCNSFKKTIFYSVFPFFKSAF